MHALGPALVVPDDWEAWTIRLRIEDGQAAAVRRRDVDGEDAPHAA
jgi:hypothetical protein